MRLAMLALVVGCGRIGFAFDQLCGNGVIDGAEQCDDGDILAGDGCDRACKIEPGFECRESDAPCLPVLGVTGTPGTALGAVGGGGGAAFSHDCAAGEVIIGIEAGILDGNLTMSRAACAPISFDAAGTLQQGSTTLTPVEGVGTPNGGQGVAYCAADALVVGYSAKPTAINFVAGIQLVCRPFTHVGGELVIGSEDRSPIIGDIAPPSVNEECSDGSVAGAFVGRSGIVTDQMSLRCDSLATVLCGDGIETRPEACDDGNVDAGDGCSPRCALE